MKAPGPDKRNLRTRRGVVRAGQLLLCVVVWLTVPHSALAWNAEGHMVVAQIAYNHLAPAVKARCDALIAVTLSYASSRTSNFVTAACWADDYKSQLGSGIWHYIDLPFSLDGTSTAGAVPDSTNVVWAINQCIAVLSNSRSSQTDQATYLRYLLHFVGDVHQPLHSSTAVSAAHPTGDAGGNAFYLNGTWSNLHYLWDDGGGYLTDSLSRPLSAASQTTLNNKVAAIEADYPGLSDAAAIPDPMAWAQEGLQVATSAAYVGITQNTTPTTAYLNTARTTAEQRMALGGHRLSSVLNGLFATNSITLSCVQSNGTFTISWGAIPGKTYHVQAKQQFTDPAWAPVADITASTNTASFSEPSKTQRLYRVAQ